MNRDTKSYEGFKGNIYKDTKGYDTIGYGHKLTEDEKKSGVYSKGLTEEQASNLYASDRAAHDQKFYKANPQYREAPANVRAALEDMAYNMGPDFLQKFPKASAHLAAGNYAGASDEFLDSKYADDVGQRAIDNAALIRGGASQQVGLAPAPMATPANPDVQSLFAGLGNVTAPAPYPDPYVYTPKAEEPMTTQGLGGFTGFAQN